METNYLSDETETSCFLTTECGRPNTWSSLRHIFSI